MRSIFRVGASRPAPSPHPKSLARTLPLRAATRFRPPHKGEVDHLAAGFTLNSFTNFFGAIFRQRRSSMPRSVFASSFAA